MTLELSPPVATVSGAVEWLYETDTPTQIVTRDAPLSVPFTVPSSGTVVVVYKPRIVTGGMSSRKWAIDVYRDGAKDSVASRSTSSGGGQYTDDTTPYTLFAPVSEGEHYLKFSASTSLLEFDVVSIRVGHIPMGPLLVGVADGWAHGSLRDWATSIGKSYATITEIPTPIKVVAPSLHWLFYGCKALTAVPAFNTREVTSMHSMFEGCSALTGVPEFDTRNVTIMQSMFYGCSSLTSIPDMDTSKVTNMKNMFYNCAALTRVPDLDTSKITDTGFLFYGCSSLTSIPDIDTSQVMNATAMFYKCSSLTSIPYMDTSRVTAMTHMFNDCTSLTSIPNMDASQATSSAFMFPGCSSLESVTLTGMGDGFTAGSDEESRSLDMRDTVLNATAANDLMRSLGTPPPGGFLKLPATARGADTSIAEAKNWTVTIR